MEKRVPSTIAVTPERLREVAAKIGVGAAEVTAILSKLAGDVAPVRSEWAGSAQVQFNALWDQFERDVSDLRSVFGGMAKLTKNAASAYEAAEQTIAKSFDEFRVEGGVVQAVAGGTRDIFVGERPIAADSGDTRPEQPEIVTDVSPELVSQMQSLPTERASGLDTVASPVATETEVNAVEETGRSAGRPLGSVRPPWARFMPKEVLHSDVGKVVTDTRRRDRRFKTSDSTLKPGTKLCQGCYTVVVLAPENIETTGTHTNFRCPNCGNSFPIRQDDIETSL